MTVITSIAQAVTDELNAGTFSQPLVAVREYWPAFDLQEMQNLHVTVVPRGVRISLADRTRVQHEVLIDIAVQKKVAQETAAELDPLMALVQEVVDFLKHRRLTAIPDAIWIRTENEPVFAQEHLSELRQFTSLLTVTYRLAR